MNEPITRLIFALLLCALASGSRAQDTTNAANGSERLSPAQQEELLTRHNHWREAVGVPPLAWSEELAAFAREWADELASRGCRMQHRPKTGRFAQKYGENLSWASPTSWSDGRIEVQSIGPSSVVDDWDSEKVDYDYESNTCAAGQVCGHYTQVVWAESRTLGCAMAICDDKGQVWVCNYAPAGNIVGKKPYQSRRRQP